METNPPTRPASPAYTILWVINLLLCLTAAEIVDHAAGTGNRTLIWGSVALLLLSLALLIWPLWRMRQVPINPAVAGAAPFISTRVACWALVTLTLLAAGLRFYGLGTESFWYDETWTASWSVQPLGAVVRMVNPLAYVVANLSLQVGRSEYVLRFAPALAGVLTVPAVYVLGRRLYGRREGLVAAFLLSVSVYAIYHSQELRFYAWQMLFSTLSLYFLLGGLEHNRKRDWLGFALSTALNLYNHSFALFVLASEGLYVAYVLAAAAVRTGDLPAAPWPARLRSCLPRALWSGTAAAIALAVYLPQWSKLIGFFNPRWVSGMPSAQAQPLIYLATPWQSDPIAFWVSGLFGVFTNLGTQPLVLHLSLGLMLLGLVCSRKRTIFLTLAWMLLPLPPLFLVGMKIHARYFSYFYPLFLALTARGMVYLAGTFSLRAKRSTLPLLILTLLVATPNALQLPDYYNQPQKTQWRELAAVIDAQHEPGDLLLINSVRSWTVSPVEWYLTTPEAELPRNLFPESGILTDLNQFDTLPTYVQGHRRIWFAFDGTPPDLRTMIVDSLGATCRQVAEWPFRGVVLRLFETGAP
jgi:mannosyltransferase